MALDQQQIRDWEAALGARLAGLDDAIDRATYVAWCERFGLAPDADQKTGWYRDGMFCYDNDPAWFYATRQCINLARHRGYLAEQTARPAPSSAAAPAETGPCWECGRPGRWNDDEQWHACAEHWNG